MRVLPEIEFDKLPDDVRAALAQLDLELSEGDITEKGYEKKHRLLLGPYIQAELNKGHVHSGQNTAGKSTNRRRTQRLTRNESRYHSEIRLEAVQAALAEWNERGKSEAPASAELTPNSPIVRSDSTVNAVQMMVGVRPDRRERAESSMKDDGAAPSNSSSEAEDASDETNEREGDVRSSSNGQRTNNSDSLQYCSVTVGQKVCMDDGAKPSCSAQIDVKATTIDVTEMVPASNYENLRDDRQLADVMAQNSKSSKNDANGTTANDKEKLAASGPSTPKSYGPPIQMRRPADYNFQRHVSPMIQRTSVLVLEDRPLPELPADASDLSDQEEDLEPSKGCELTGSPGRNDDQTAAAYINTRTSTNDSGLGGSSKAPQDYANADFPLKSTKVSLKIQQLLLTLQTLSIQLDSMFVSMMEHRSPERHYNAAAAGGRLHVNYKNNLAGGYHHHRPRPHAGAVRQLSGETPTGRTQAFPLLKIENQLRAKMAVASNGSPAPIVVSPVKNNGYNRSAGSSNLNNDWPVAQSGVAQKRSVRVASKEDPKPYPYRQQSALCRDPYDHRNPGSGSTNATARPTVVLVGSSVTPFADRKPTEYRARSQSRGAPYRISVNGAAENVSNDLIRRQHSVAELQKRLTKKELMRCKVTVMNVSDANVIPSAKSTPRTTPISTSVHSSISDLNHIDRTKKPADMVDNDYYEVENIIAKPAQDKRTSSHKYTKKSSASKLDRLAMDLRGADSEESQSFEDVKESKLFPNSPMTVYQSDVDPPTTESLKMRPGESISMRIRGGRSRETGAAGNLMRSKSQSRANVNSIVSPDMIGTKINNDMDVTGRQNAFFLGRSKTSANFSAAKSTSPSGFTIQPTFSTRKRASSTSKKRSTGQSRNDHTLIFGVFNPVENDRRRAAQRDQAHAMAQDRLGFESSHKKLAAFNRLKELSINRWRMQRVADLPGIEQIHSAQIFKKYKHFQRPKKKALQEYYNDDDAELEAMAKVVDPNAPKPTGTLITPIRGDFPKSAGHSNASQIPHTIDAILQRHASGARSKATAGIVLDVFGKSSVTLTYGKLLSRATKIAHMLLTKQVTIVSAGVKEKVHLCLPGDRVALVYPNTEPLAFLTAFYGCLLAGVVPVPIEVPLTKRDAGIQQFGFLLGSCGVRVALTSESCLKGLPKVGSQSGSSQNSNNSSNAIGTGPAAGGVPPSLYTGTTSSSGGGSFHHNHHHNSNSSFPSSTTGSGGSAGAGGGSGLYGHHYATSANANDVADFKCWPRLHWTTTINLPKPAKDWTPPSLLVNDECAYIEYTTDREGGIKGVCVSRQAMVAHCRAIAMTMNYKEGDTIVSVLDFKRDVGFWHAILTAIYTGMRVHFVPYSLMKINPLSWLTQVTKSQAGFALARSRDLHWSLMAYEAMRRDGGTTANGSSSKELPLSLSSLSAVVVADGANPWSLSSCDQFLETFRALGLHSEAICPCAGSPETGMIALRRPTTFVANNATYGKPAAARSGRGILSMLALTHSVVRVDQENSLTSLTLQDAGHVIPGGMVILVKPTGPAKLCRADEIGEICLHAPSTASCYLGLKRVSQQTFAVSPLGPDDRPLGPANHVRSGLVGFLGPNGLVFIIGSKTTQLYVGGRQHSADDLIATVFAVKPMKFVYRGRIAVFSVPVLRDERICVIAEQKPDISEEDAFNWMVRVLHAVDSIHQVGIYCLALLPPNQMPKTPLNGIHVPETRRRFLDGCLHPTTVLMCPQNCVLNLPKPREPQSHDVGPAAMFVGNIVQGVRIAGAQGRELTIASDETINFIDILRQRAAQTPDHSLYTMVNAKGTEVDTLCCQQLLKRAERIGALLLDKGRLAPGDHVALIFPPGIELITAFYGCLSVGLVPVCIRPPSTINLQASLITVRMVVDVSKSVALLSNSTLIKLLKSKEASSHRLNTKAWPTILDIDDAPSSSVARRQKNNGVMTSLDVSKRPNDTCYLDFSVSTTGQLTGVVVTTLGAATQCKSLKINCELYPSRDVALCLDPYSGIGFTMWCLASVYAGHHSILISPSELEHNAATWLNTISQNKVRDTFCSYSVLEMCVRELAPQIQQMKEKGLNLSCLRSCVVVAEERPRVQLCNTFVKMLAPLGLTPRSVSTSFGARVNAAICMQGASSPDPSTLYVDVRALRNDRVTLVEKGAPHSIPLMESGKLLPGVKVAIANPETKGQCADSHLGEIWVAGGHNTAGYFSIFGDDTHLHTDHFNARLKTGDTKTTFARTGYLGFLHQTQSITAEGELHDAVFVVGALDETLMLRGMRYHPVDIENTVIRSHKNICESAVFTWTHLLVVVAETDAPESDALDLVPAITSAVLEEQHLVVGVVMIIDPATIPINSRGEKQRLHLRDAFLKDQLDPIYVAYNM